MGKNERIGAPDGSGKSEKLGSKHYKKALNDLQVELVKLQNWVLHKKLKVVVIFEGRDAAGKGGVIKRITHRLIPIEEAPVDRTRGLRQLARVLLALSVVVLAVLS